MKILITFYNIMDYGGIINNHEGLVAGLQELGHEVTTKLLVWKDSVRTAKSDRRLRAERSATGMAFDQQLGWIWPESARFAYKGKYNLDRWKTYASRFDLIIWQIPVPSKNSANRGNTDWLELYNVPVKQIAYVHDGNMRDSYPWIALVAHKFCGAAGTHPCSYHSLRLLPVPRALAFSAQQNVEARIKMAEETIENRDGWLSLQTFKGWKHVDDLVRAVPYMRKYPRLLAGGGIHYYYLTSKDKMKDEYVATRERDPDLPEIMEGRPIWQNALEAGMQYLDYLTTEERDDTLRSCKFLIDPSWSHKFAEFGDHPNRTPIDGILAGCVPIARNRGFVGADDGCGEFFRAGEGFVMIPWNATPKEFATIVNDAMAMTEQRRTWMLEHGLRVAKLWAAPRVAQTFIDLALGQPAGVYKDRGVERGLVTNSMVEDGHRALEQFFGSSAKEAAE